MFGSQKVNVPTEITPGPVFDPKSIPTHTMQDDLDRLSGKVKITEPAFKEDKADSFGSDNKDASHSLAESPFAQPLVSNSETLKVRNVATAPTPNTSSPFSHSNLDQNKVNKPADMPVEMPNTSNNIGESPKKASNLGKTMVIFAGVLVFIGALGGGYYFYMTRYNNPEIELVEVPVEIIPEEIPEVVVPDKFSADKPNYLSLDVEGMDLADIQSLLSSKAAEIKEDGKTTPIEFVITDVNNNPIALKIFALLMKIDFSQKLLDNFKDEFSMYVFLDGENVRLGLSIISDDTEKAFTDMKVEEKSMVKVLESLFLGETVKSQSLSFQDAQYRNVDIRYINLNEEGNLSVDYFKDQNRIIVATSKNATWSIIDKIRPSSQQPATLDERGQ